MKTIGIDISQDWFDAAFEASGRHRKSRFANTRKGFSEFHKWLKKNDIQKPHLFMEATGRYWEPLAMWCCSQGWPVTVLNPRHVRKFAESSGRYNKSDPLDSECLAEFGQTCRSEQARLWKPRSTAQAELREIHMEIEGVKRMITAERNRSKSCLRSIFVADVIRGNIEQLNAVRKELEKRALMIIKGSPELLPLYRALKMVKGFGDTSIIVLLAKIDFDQFKKGRQLVGFAGLAPRKWESGKSVHKKETISRIGHADLRAALYFPAITAMTHDPEMVEYKRHLQSLGKENKVIICAVMARMLRKAFAVVRDTKRAAQAAPVAA